MSQLDSIPAGAVVRARPWDVIGAGLAAPMVLWGFLGWFGTAGDAGGGVPGFYAGTGAAGIGLVLAATALTLNQVLAGRPHERASPPVAVFLAGAASIIILGGMVAKPDSATIQAGSVAGLLTALSQGAVLIRGWLRGSQKSVKAANVRALNERQAAADYAAAGGYGAPRGYPAGPPPAGYGMPAGAVTAGYQGWPGYQGGGYPAPPAPRYPQFPPPGYPAQRPAGPPPGYQPGPPPGYPPPPQGYPPGSAPGYPPGPPGAAGPGGRPQGGQPG